MTDNNICIYSCHTYDGTERQLIGERKSRNQRVCRFCGRSYPDVKFNSKAHALSEFLGNKNIIGLDECDDCNTRFSSLEEQFFNRHAILFPLYGIRGKSGIPKIKTPSADISSKNEITLINSHMPADELLDIENGKNGTLNVSFTKTSRPYVPQNIYKCLAKYACSVISSQNLGCITETLSWINSDTFYSGKLPPIILFPPNEFYSHPRITIYTRSKLT